MGQAERESCGAERVAGCDEVGRGTWAGPVVAAAVILDPARPIDGLRDSKALSPRRREELAARIRDCSLAWAIAAASVEEVDALNILRATLLAMQRAVAALGTRPDRVLVDGNRLPDLPMPALAVVRGDATVPAIAAASIIAKVHRDALMRELAILHPGYGFERHVGYGTMEHAQALQQHGPCALHRRSFAPIRRLIAATPAQDRT